MKKKEEKGGKKGKKPEIIIQDTQSFISKDGEILFARRTKTIPIGKEPPFFKYYIDDMAALLKLNISEKNVFEICACNMTFSNTVLLDREAKKQIAKQLRKGFDTVEAAIKSLKREGVLLSIEGRRGLYRINPIFAAKGSWADVKALRIEIEYSDNGRKISTNVVGNKVVEVEISSENPYFEKD